MSDDYIHIKTLRKVILKDRVYNPAHSKEISNMPTILKGRSKNISINGP